MATNRILAGTLLALGATTAVPAAAEALSVSVAPNSGPATQTCSGAGPLTSTHDPIRTSSTCTDFFGRVGTASGTAISAGGHVGASVHADSHNNDSLFAGIGANAIYSDFLLFTSSNSNQLSTETSVELLLDGLFESGGLVASGELTLKVYLGRNTLAVGELHMLDGQVLAMTGLSVTSGALGPVTHAGLVSSTVNVPLDTPVFFEIDLLLGAAASGPDSHALADFASNSVKLPTGRDAFNLPDGMTVNAGDYLVDNRFIDPLASPGTPVPVPASLPLALAGLGLLSVTRRRRVSDRR